MSHQVVGAPEPVRLDLAGGVGAAFTTRAGGASQGPYASLNLGGGVGDEPAAVSTNRDLVAAALGLDAGHVVWMRQVHGTDVAVAGGPVTPRPGPPGDPGLLAGPPAQRSGSPDGPREAAGAPLADAVVTTRPGLALAVLVADCAPVLLADAAAGVVAAVHSGRPGTAAGVVPAAVAAMCEHGARPAGIVALIGPSVCGRCYEVPAALHDEVAAVVPETSCRTRAGTPGLDIRAGIVAQLHAAGVGRVQHDQRCTMESPELYSYRRDGKTGRFAGYVWLAP